MRGIRKVGEGGLWEEVGWMGCVWENYRFFYFISHVIGVIKLLREDLKAFGDTKPNKKEDHGKCTYALNAECPVFDDRSNQQWGQTISPKGVGSVTSRPFRKLWHTDRPTNQATDGHDCHREKSNIDLHEKYNLKSQKNGHNFVNMIFTC